MKTLFLLLLTTTAALAQPIPECFVTEPRNPRPFHFEYVPPIPRPAPTPTVHPTRAIPVFPTPPMPGSKK